MYSPCHCSLRGGKKESQKGLKCGLKVLNSERKLSIHSTLCDLQEKEEEVIQDLDLQEEDQEVIETWSTKAKACTCDCESARIPAVIPPVPPTSLPTPPPSQSHLLNCMPGEDSTCVVLCLFHLYSCWMPFFRF